MPSTRLIPAAAVLSMALAAPAFAQFGNPAGLLPGTPESRPGEPAPRVGNAQDRLFVQLVGRGQAGEVALGRLADSRTGSAPVREFARHMVADHTTMSERLAAAADPLQVKVTTEPDPDQRATRARLEGLRGTAFDLAYLQGQLVDHQKTIVLLHWQIANGQDAGLQAFSKEALPAVYAHLEAVQSLLGELTQAGPQGLAVTGERAPARKH